MCEVKQKEQVIPAHDWFAMLEPLLHDGCELKISPAGMSMYPFLVGGRDKVFLCAKQTRLPKRGDICLFSRDDRLFILHRVHHINQYGYFMLGDAQTQIEGPIKEENIHAIASAVVWRGKKIPSRRCRDSLQVSSLPAASAVFRLSLAPVLVFPCSCLLP